MKRSFTASMITVVLVVAIAACGSSGDLSRAETQRQFGVRMARMNLWREAMFRFKRAVEIEPANAMAHNNLAVAYEANGDFDNAAKEYREALKLDRGNQHIQKNYSRHVEFMTRSRKRDAKPAVTTTAAGATTPATAITGSGTSGAAPNPPPPHGGTTATDTTGTVARPPVKPPQNGDSQ